MTDDAARAYLAGLQWLSRRELTEAQLRQRLARRAFAPDIIDTAITRLREERALDDQRAALACARTEVRLRGRGRRRVEQRLITLGINRDVARGAVAEAFGDVDEAALIDRAIDRRLRRGESLADRAVRARVYRFLLGQGFDGDRVAEALRRRASRDAL
jgi:regulatory protein